MSINKKIHYFLPIIVFFAGMLPILYNIDTMGLLEPTEGIIASVARYMVENQDYSTPIYNGIKFFDYAPGSYWITALGIKLFGINEFGVRFFLCVASGITAICIYFIANLFFGVQCALIASLLLITSALFQISFRFVNPAIYCTAFETFLCLIFFLYLNKPSKFFRLIFWMGLSFGFLLNGFSIFLPILSLSTVAFYTGQKNQISKLYDFIPGIISFFIIGLSWYFIQIVINPGLFNYYLFELPYKLFFIDYHGTPFYVFILLPFFAVFPWTSIWIQDLKEKLPHFKEEPVITYLISWAFFPFIIRLFMTSRECVSFMSSVAPLLLLTAPAFQTIYMKKNDNSEKSVDIIKQRRKHNLILVILVTIIGMSFSVYGYLNFEECRIISQTLIYTGLAWLFSSLIMLAFMIKKLNKSVLIPASMLIPVLIHFTVPAIHGQEPYYKNNYLPSKHNLLKRIIYTIEQNSEHTQEQVTDFIICGKPILSSYFYTGKNFKLFDVKGNFDFTTSEGINYLIIDQESMNNKILPESRFVMPANQRDDFSKKLNKELILSAEESDWIVVTTKKGLQNGI